MSNLVQDTTAPGLLFFDSSHTPVPSAQHARWSVILAWPVDTYLYEDGHTVEDLLQWSRPYLETQPNPHQLPFIGGIAGMLAFEYAWQLDSVHEPPISSTQFALPLAWVTAHDRALIFDHDVQKWWAVGPSRTSVTALKVLVEQSCCTKLYDAQVDSVKMDVGVDYQLVSDDGLVEGDIYTRSVEHARHAIFNGDLFEVNYTERFCTSSMSKSWMFYQSMARRSSGQFFGYIQTPKWSLLSVSPEQFLKVEGRHVSTKPIKGSCARDMQDPVEDRRLAQALLASVKDRAENMMIVDLMRNDLTRICEPKSVEATKICALESYAGIHHLVSTVEGQLAEHVSAFEAFLACFPAGSITGAPKLRAIEYIAKLEHSPRGAYTGAMFYVSAHGRLDSSVLIRTAEWVDGQIRYGAGGAVVYDSDPQLEYQEAILKTRPLRLDLEIKSSEESK